MKKKESKLDALSIETKADYIRLAMGLSGIAIGEEMALKVVLLYEKVEELGGSFSIKDAVDVRLKAEYQWAEINVRREKITVKATSTKKKK
jgi:hypothetical protein